MIRTIIVDDEKHCRTSLEYQLHQIGMTEVTASCGNIEEARQAIRTNEPDLLFLDVELSDSTGFELLKGLTHNGFNVIFTTAHHQYALQAIKASALDYLLKPISLSELTEAIQKHVARKKQSHVAEQVAVLFDHYLKTSNHRGLALPTMEGLEFIAVQDIVRLESDSNYTTFHLVHQRKIVVPKTLKEYEDVLEEQGFARIHRSHIVNLAYLDKYFKGDGGYVKMKDGSTAEVSRQRKEAFLAVLGKM